MSRLITRGLVICVCSALLTLFVGVGTSHAQATTNKFYSVTPVTGTTPLPECTQSDVVGTLSLTNTVRGTSTVTDTGFHLEGSETEAYRVDFPDGSYVIGVAISRFNFNATPSGVTSFTTASREPRTIYNAAGEPVGTVFIHYLSHITYQDVNGNGSPDDGEITSSVEKFFFTCG